MIQTTATATEMQNNFGKYLKMLLAGTEIIVTKNGIEVGRFIPKDAVASSLTDSLTGILSNKQSAKEARKERLANKYATSH